MDNNEKLKNDKFEKEFEENERLIKLVNEDIERFVENMMIIDRIKKELEDSIKERQDEPKNENLYDFDDLSEKRDEIYKLTADRFNRLLKSKGVNTELYSLYKYDYANMNIFGDSYLNCTVEGILDSDFMPDMMAYLLKIAEKVCNAVDYKDFKLVRIRISEESKNSDEVAVFDVTFKSNTYYYDTIKVGFREGLEGDFDPFIKSYAELNASGKKTIPSILPSGIVNGEIGPITSTFTSGGELDYNDDKTYDKIASAMKTNRKNLEDKFKSIINDMSIWKYWEGNNND